MTNPKTLEQYDSAVEKCHDIFVKKGKDYGTSWTILRHTSLIDQIFIKAKRIRTIEENGEMKVEEGAESEYIGIVNYCAMGLIRSQLGSRAESEDFELSMEEAERIYNEVVADTRALMERKNHDYGEAWREMKISSLTDMILQKLMRMKQIERNDQKTLISEGLDANYHDMINYAIFALIRIGE